MKISLNEFEHVIDETILKRGLTYFEKGHITELSIIEKGQYEAIVEGQETYTVQIDIKNNIIQDYNCDCPYDYGVICKHVVAVIFHLQMEFLDLDVKKTRKPKTKKPRKKSVHQLVKELLKIIPEDELIDFLTKLSKKDRNFRNVFITTFGHLNQEQSKEFYQEQIKNILKAARGRKGWIDWNDMKGVVNMTEPFLQNANSYIEKEQFENVFFIATALLDEFAKAIEYADDSNGDIGYFISSSIEILDDLTTNNISKNLKNEIFDYCILSFNNEYFEGWDWQYNVLDLATKLIENEKDIAKVMNCLNHLENKNETYSDYSKEFAQVKKLDLIRRFKTEKEAQEYVNKHISNSKIRADEIKRAIENKNYKRAITLSKDGIEYDQKDKPGLVKVWYDYLLEIAIAQKNTAKIIEYARFRLIDNFAGRMDYYQILKSAVKKENWTAFLNHLINEIQATDIYRRNNSLISEIYIKEKWWDRLLELLLKNTSLRNIEVFEPYLAKDYSTELIELYEKEIKSYLNNHYQMNRKTYKEACRYLRRMKKLGGTKKVDEIITYLKNKYPKRPALLDELNKV